MPPSSLEKTRLGSASDQRIVWLDLLRVLCAIEIVGFHWLRAATKSGAFAKPLAESFILSYRQLDIGFAEAIHRLHADGSPSVWHRWAVDSFGLLFGFGWEAVFVFVFLSGVSLSLSLRGRPRPVSWPAWIAARLQRILLPFYLIASIVGVLMFTALALSASRNGSGFHQIHEKLAENIGSDIPGLIWSHLLLIDPHQPLWDASFLAPAWWFVPAIVVAYALFPFYSWLLQRVGTVLFLTIGAAISIASYAYFQHAHLQEFAWSFIAFNECFNFFLGIVVGRSLATRAGGMRIERALQSPPLVIVAMAIFLAGNVCNLYGFTYPISSLLFTGALAFCGAAFAQWLSRWKLARPLLLVDPYVLYLVHQPIAFPLMVLSQTVFGGVAIFAGLPIYFGSALLAALLFAKLFTTILGGRLRTAPLRPEAEPANS